VHATLHATWLRKDPLHLIPEKSFVDEERPHAGPGQRSNRAPQSSAEHDRIPFMRANDPALCLHASISLEEVHDLRVIKDHSIHWQGSDALDSRDEGARPR
jgi:hypothetical protein